MSVPLRTVGHGTLPADALASLLTGAGVDQVVDVRSFPGSRRHPHYGRAQLERWLPESGIAYSWDPRLGGRRHLTEPSANTALRNEAFRAYADHMVGAEFGAGLDDLIEVSQRTTTAVMCAESVWWRCHRQLLADAVVVLRGIAVEHLFHDGRGATHVPSAHARRVDDHLVYDLGTTQPLL